MSQSLARPIRLSELERRPLHISSPWQKARATMWHMFRSLLIAASVMASVAITWTVSYYFLSGQSLRLDEAQSLWQTSHSLAGVLKVVAEDVHVPLYHILLHFWQQYIAQGIESARLLSLLFFTATVPFVYLLARQVLSRAWSLAAVLLFCISPFINWYANEARMYTLLALLAVANQYFFVRIIKHNKGWWGWGITVLIGAYAHYFFMFNLAAQAVFYLLNRKVFAPQSFRKFVLIAVLLVVEMIPWFWYFYSLGSASNTSPMLPRPSTVDFFNAYSQFIFGFQNDRINTILVSFWPLLVLAGLFAVHRHQKLTPAVQYLIAVCTVPILLAFLVSITIHPFFLSRYMVSSVAALLIVLVWFASHYAKRFAVLSVVGLVVVSGFMSYRQVTAFDNPVREDYQQVAQDIESRVNPQDIVVLSAPFTVYPFQYYYEGDARIATLPLWNQQEAGAIPPFEPSKLPEQVNQLKQDHEYLYLVLSQDQGYEKQIKTYFDMNLERIDAKEYAPGLNLYVYKVGYYTVPPIGQTEPQ